MGAAHPIGLLLECLPSRACAYVIGITSKVEPMILPASGGVSGPMNAMKIAIGGTTGRVGVIHALGLGGRLVAPTRCPTCCHLVSR